MDAHRKAINQWLKDRKIGQLTVQVRRNARTGTYRAFLCAFWRGASILQFRPTEGGYFCTLIDTKSGKEVELGSFFSKASAS